MTQTETTKHAISAFVEMAKEFGTIIERVDEFCDWHLSIQDLNMDDDNIDADFFSIKNPTIADRSMYAFLKGIPEWARHAVLDCYESELIK